ncbi:MULTISPECIES: hypothetical protein [Bifidobacterium]|uniref:hypothetical protein n=1 Tax=Bifidobacterium TaxID=1678 RepID=UPI001BDC9126|nr:MULTISPECIES: hypothetical protein [Bifidobacterium]MBT1160998.1 hypothetical protein [Bifidobacterium sp. SO1]MBW3079528.1 hypothetical protein [Bifidobacterium simiiventris]
MGTIYSRTPGSGTSSTGTPSSASSRTRASRMIVAVVALVIIALAAGIAYGVSRAHRLQYTILVLGDESAVSRAQRLREGLVSAADLSDDQITVDDLSDEVSLHDTDGATTLSNADRQHIVDLMLKLRQQGGGALIAPASLFDSTTDQQTCSNDLSGYVVTNEQSTLDTATLPLSRSFAATLPDDAWYYTTCSDGEPADDAATNDNLARRCEYDAERGSTICATERGATEYRPAASVIPPGDDVRAICEDTGSCVWEQDGMLQRYAVKPQGLDLRKSAIWASFGGTNTASDAGTTSSAYVVTLFPDESLNNSSRTLNDAFVRYLEF